MKITVHFDQGSASEMSRPKSGTNSEKLRISHVEIEGDEVESVAVEYNNGCNAKPESFRIHLHHPYLCHHVISRRESKIGIDAIWPAGFSGDPRDLM